MNNLDQPVNITNGPKGIGQIDSVKVFGFDLAKRHEFFGFDVASVTMYYYLFLVLVLFTVADLLPPAGLAYWPCLDGDS